MRKANIAIVGATGMVGQTAIKVLEERKFPINSISFFASKNSVDQEVEFLGEIYKIEELNEHSFDRTLDIALFCVEENLSAIYGKIAREKGIVVIDNSSAWRMSDDVPLVVPEINQELIKKHQGIIANPNCTTIQAVLPLAIIHQFYQIKRIAYTSYQAVSGSGFKGIEDLENGILGRMPIYYPKPIFNNCFPQVDGFLDNGFTVEETKMIQETKKILADEQILITATCVRIPVYVGHSIAINLECSKPFDLKTLIKQLKMQKGLVIYDFPSYPTTIDAVNQDLVHVGRIRRDYTVANGLHLWVVADNVRKGAATNAIQIAEVLLEGEK